VGLCSYYRRFIAGFADTAAPLHALSGKGVHFSWGPEQETAFVALKEKLTTAPVLGMPEPDGKYILDTDASDVGLGAVCHKFKTRRRESLPTPHEHYRKPNETMRRRKRSC